MSATEPPGEGDRMRGLALTIEQLDGRRRARSRSGASSTSSTPTRSTRSSRASRRWQPALHLPRPARADASSTPAGWPAWSPPAAGRRKAGRRLVLVRGSAAVQRVFQLTAVDEAFEIVNAARASLTA